jgi:hypothetical protein
MDDRKVVIGRTKGNWKMEKVFRLTAAVLSLIAGLTLTGCDKKSNSNDSGNQVVALTPYASPTQACAQSRTFNSHQGANQVWGNQPHAQLNMVPYGYDFNGQPIQLGPYAQHNPNHGFCGCPQGSQPMCDGTHGMVCVPTQHLHGHNIAWWQMGQSGFAFAGYGGYAGYGHVANNPVIYHHQPYPPQHRRGRRQPVAYQQTQTTLSCASQIGQTCTVGYHTCGDRAFCRPLAPNTNVGVCAR